MRLVFVVDRIDWALGRFAREIAQRLPSYVDSKIWESAAIDRHPARFTCELRQAHVVHWMPEGYFLRLRGLAPAGAAHLVSVFHLTELALWHPEQYTGATIIAMAEQWRASLESKGTRVAAVVPFGIDTELFRPWPRLEMRQKLGLDPGGFYVCMAGKASSDENGRKGLDVFRRICAELASEDGVKVVLIGEGWAPLRAALNSEGVEVRVFEAVSDGALAQIYSATDAYLCTSRIEGGPLPILEAMACGVPVVTTPVGHVPELIDDGDNGVLFPLDDHAAGAARVRDLHRDASRSAAIGARAREAMVAKGSWDAVAERYEAVLAEARQRPLDQVSPAERLTAVADVAMSAAKARVPAVVARWVRRGIGRRP